MKYRKELKLVRYDVIYDDKTHVTIPVSLLKHFAYKHDISLMDRFKHSYAVENEDMRECLRNPELKNVRQINKRDAVPWLSGRDGRRRKIYLYTWRYFL
ncbi:hypothetical protein NXV08_00215 (plasmid) [Bacteroides fragilis]|nr:hypothetical protein [Bacteroides fragilis]